MKKVTIVLPVYNVEKYIGDCIKSIIGQKCRDFDLLIVDDGSKDSSIAIAEDMLRKSDIIYRVVRRENGGLSAARNTGIQNATGDYLAFVDSDDVINPDYVSVLLADVIENDVDLAIATYKDVTENTKFDFDNRNIKGHVVDKHDFLNKILKRKIFNYFGCFLISREYIINNNMFFDESVFFGVDQAYMWRLMVGVPRYTYSEKIVYNYFDRPGSIMTGTKIKKMLSGLPSLIKCAEELKDNPYFDSQLIVIRWKISALHTIAKSFDYSQFLGAIELFKPDVKECLRYPDVRIKMMYISWLLGKRAFYWTLKMF